MVHVSCCVLGNLAAVLLRKSVTLVFVQKKELDDLANKMKQHCPQNLFALGQCFFGEKKKKKVSEISNAQGKMGNYYTIKITLKESHIVQRGKRTFQEVITFSNSALDTFFTFKRKQKIISQ